MKLTIEKLTQPSAQDQIDLAKIWQDERYQTALTTPITNEKPLFIARFNERLLAACRVDLSGESALITDFMVREVTRRRGVGHYLLSQCLAAYPAITHWQAINLSIEEPDNSIANAFLIYHQFIKSEQQPNIYDYFVKDNP
ncbi:aspartate 1-decarboxylase autocleavage activator PanM [Proteus hauseri]|uniref:aspartate 1-decarboxylase autocleavage activator PanM n=1 Tax=Proteus hauseri TaxID=183417 RepID=UPI0032D9DBE0